MILFYNFVWLLLQIIGSRHSFDFTWCNVPKFDLLYTKGFNQIHTPICRSGNTFTWLSVIERLHVEDSCTWLWDNFTNYIGPSYLYVTPKRIDHSVYKIGVIGRVGELLIWNSTTNTTKKIFDFICWNYLVPSFQWNSISVCSKPALQST